MPAAVKTFAAVASTEPPRGTPARLGRAVVLGGSVAGMLAARVLADHAETVLVIERDEPEGSAPRRSVPQGGQAHALLAAGYRQLERWFPGFTERAVADGACLVAQEQMATYSEGVRKARGADIELLCATRPFLESQVRSALFALPNVKAVTGRVTGLEFSDTAVTGVRLEHGHEPADLVVDAMGRASVLSNWLAEAGWESPPLTRVVTGVNYATAFFRRLPGDHPIAAALATNPPGAVLSGASFLPVEGDRWIMMMAGVGEHRPGATTEDLIRRCRQELPEPFGRIVTNELLGEVATYRQGDSRRRDFAGCERLPARLVAVGDAVASFNPIYGQGMSSAALHASCLSMFLRSESDLDAPARPFFALQQVIVDAAWRISTAHDGAKQTSARDRVTRWLVRQVVNATVTDARVNAVFQAVGQMVEHPAVLARPRVLWRAIRARRHPRPAPTPPLG